MTNSWIGQSVIAAVAAASGLAAAGLLSYVVIFKILKNRRNPRVPQLNNAMPYFFVNLLALDVVMAIGSAMNFHWAKVGKVDGGDYCIAQAVIKQFGNNGVAWQTTVIAVYSVIWYNEWDDKRPHLTGSVLVVAIWVGLAIMAAVPQVLDTGFYGPASGWCWITGNGWDQKTARITTTYLWFWICAGVTLLAYIGIYLDAAGRLAGAFGKNGVWVGLKSPTTGRVWGCGVFGSPLAVMGKPRATDEDPGAENAHPNGVQVTHINDQEHRECVQKAKILLWYPASYALCIIPQSVIRLIELNEGRYVPLWAKILGGTVLNLSGLINAILYWMGCRHFGIPEPVKESEPILEGEGIPPRNAPPV